MLELVLPATPASVPALRAAVVDFARETGLPAERLADLRLAVTEACANVVAHAYESEEPGDIALTAETGPGSLVVRIRDAGRGVSSRSPNAGLGMGMRLIAACSDEMRVERPPAGGTEVELCFRFGHRARTERSARAGRASGPGPRGAAQLACALV